MKNYPFLIVELILLPTGKNILLGDRHAHFEGVFHGGPPLLEVNGLE